MEIWEQALIGSILGDGYLDVRSSGKAILQLKYKSASVKYLEWLRKIFNQGLKMSDIKFRENYQQHYCYSSPSEELIKWWQIFYPNSKKTIPLNINELLKYPLSLAVWYQDDGCLDYRKKYHFNAKLATYCFSYKECCLLTGVMYKNFGIKTAVHKSTMRGKIYYCMYIRSESMKKFIDTVKHYVHPVFDYKIKT